MTNIFAKGAANNIFSNSSTQSTQATSSIFNNNTSSLFGNTNNNSNQSTSNANIFANINKSTQPGNIFSNNQTATTNPQAGNIFANQNTQQQNAPTNNIFASTTNNSTSNLFNNNSNQNSSSINLFNNNSSNNNTTNLFNNNSANTSTNLFNNNSNNNTTNLFAQPSQSTNLFSNTTNTTTIPQTMPSNLFSATNSPFAFSQQEQIENQHVLSYIMNYKNGTIQDIFGSQVNSLVVPQSNLLKNTKVKVFDNQSFKNIMLSLMQKMVNLQRKTSQISQKQSTLFDKFQEYHRLVLDKIKLFKQNHVQFSTSSLYINDIKNLLQKMQFLVTTQFNTFLNSIKSGRKNFTISKPSTFEVHLCQLMLEQSRNLYDQIFQYQSCQDQTSQTTVFQIICLLVQYYKNVSCLVYQFKQKYNQNKNEIMRKHMASVQDLQTNIKQQQKNWLIFDKVYQMQKMAEKMVGRLREIKQKMENKINLK